MDLEEVGGKIWTGCAWIRIGTNELSGSIKDGEFLD
jgi:hypothetical protein